MVDVGGARVWTCTTGSGDPIILCNGGPGCCDYLEPVAEMMDDIMTVHRWEQRGCGRSDLTGPYDQATCLRDLERLREHFGYERWVVGGHSWGANLAIVYALEHPDRVRGVLAMAGTGITEDWKEEYRRARDERGETLPEFRFPYNREVNQEGNRSRTEYLQQPDLRDRLARLDVPVLLLQGSEDIRPVRPAAELATLLPNATLKVIAGAPHWLWLSHAEAVRDAVREFLLALPGREG